MLTSCCFFFQDWHYEQLARLDELHLDKLILISSKPPTDLSASLSSIKLKGKAKLAIAVLDKNWLTKAKKSTWT